MDAGTNFIPVSFITGFKNLQILILSCDHSKKFEESAKLQDVILPQLKILDFKDKYPNRKHLSKFLENNGRNLKEIYLFDSVNSLNLIIANFCPNLLSLYAIICQ